MSSPHIVYIVGTLRFGGAERTVLDLATTPELKDYKRSILCLQEAEGEYLKIAQANKISVYTCPYEWRQFKITPSYRVNQWIRKIIRASFALRLGAYLRKTVAADIVHSHYSWQIFSQATATLRYARLPFVWTLQALYQSRGKDVSQWNDTIDLINKSPQAAVTGISQAVLNELNAISPPFKSKIRLIPNGVNIQNFSRESRSLKWRQELDIDSEAIVFGTAGRLINEKGHIFFLEAASFLIQEGNNAYFVIAGDGELRETLEKTIKDLHIENRARIMGFQANIQSFLRELDVFVFPSVSEGMGIALIEACAMGLPCISTTADGLREVLTDNSGLLVKPGSSDDLARAMRMMLSLEVREKFSGASRIVAQKYSLTEICKQYDILYQQILR